MRGDAGEFEQHIQLLSGRRGNADLGCEAC
jgi:hypothetical protein